MMANLSAEAIERIAKAKNKAYIFFSEIERLRNDAC